MKKVTESKTLSSMVDMSVKYYMFCLGWRTHSARFLSENRLKQDDLEKIEFLLGAALMFNPISSENSPAERQSSCSGSSLTAYF